MSSGSRFLVVFLSSLLIAPILPPVTGQAGASSSITITAPTQGSAHEATLLDVTGTVQLVGVGPPTGTSLFLVGDGTTTVVAPADLTDSYALSSAGNGGLETRYVTAGSSSPSAPNNVQQPTFTGNERVILSGLPIRLHTFVDYSFVANPQTNLCRLYAQLFDNQGRVIGGAQETSVVVQPGLGTFREAIFTFNPKPGTYAGLQVQFGSFTLPCGAFPATWAWGTDALNARLVLSDQDFVGAGSEEVRIFLDAEATPRAVLSVATTAAAPSASWSTQLDVAGLAGAHTIRADWLRGEGNIIDSDAVNVLLINASPGSVTITSPQAGSTADPPFSLEGAYETPASFTQPASFGGDFEEAMPDTVQAWYESEFVRATLASPAYADLTARLAKVPGFVAAHPWPQTEGVRVLLSSPVAPALPVASPWPLEFVLNQRPNSLLTPADGEVRMISLEDLEKHPMTGAPVANGPQSPDQAGVGIQAGAGPGTAIRMGRADGTFICTASYLFQDPATTKYYLGTAGHCLMAGAAPSSVTHPDKRANWVAICISLCANNFAGVGNFVRLDPNPSTGYHPVAFAINQGVGLDFALIEIPPGVNQFLRPWMWFWGGPQAVERAAIGNPLAHWGHGVPIGASFATQGRLGVTLGASNSGVSGAGWVMGGDSGSSVGTAVRTDRLVVGRGAAGTITHAITEIGFPLFFGTDLSRGQDFAEAALGFRPELVTEDEIISGGEPIIPLESAVSNPAAGANLNRESTPVAEVTGTATFPLEGHPGTETLAYYLHRNACGPGQVLSMSTDNFGPEGGNGCVQIFHPVGSVFETIGGPFNDPYPSKPAPASDVLLDRTRPVAVTLYYSGVRGTTPQGELPNRIPSVLNDIEVRLTATGGILVGKERLTNQIILGEEPTPVTFTFLPSAARLPAGFAFVISVIVHEATGPVSPYYDDPFASRIDLPLAAAPANVVEVSVDDPTFALASQLPVTGTTTWTAPWDISGVSLGPHTLYVRAGQDGTFEDPVTIRAVTIRDDNPTASFEFATEFLTVTFVDGSLPGIAPITAWDWSFGDGSTSAEQDPAHTYADAGTYTVTLIVTDERGRAGIATRTVDVVHPPWAVEVRLLGPDGSEAFGWRTVALPGTNERGTWSHDWDPAESYEGGDYAVEARLREHGATIASDRVEFTVLPPNVSPAADVDAAKRAKVGKAVQFSGNATDPDGTIVAYAWDFGDGTTATGQTARHAFDAPGSYTVTLTATDDRGGTGLATHAIGIMDDPSA